MATMPRSLAWLAFLSAAIVATPTISAAHVKWFCASADVAEIPVPLTEVLSPLFLFSCGGFVLLAFGVYLADGAIARVWPAMARTGPRLAAAEEVIVRAAVGAYFFALWTNMVAAPWADGDAILTPETVPRTMVWGIIQLAVTVLVVRRETCFAAALGIVALYARGTASYGVFQMMDYVFFLGLAAYLAVTSLGSPRALRLRVPVLVGSLAFSLMWTAIEKFLYPRWSIEVLAEHPNMTFGYDWPLVVVVAGFIEFSFGFFLATGRGLLRVGAVMIAAVFLSAIPEFGRVDLFGHLPIVAILVVAWLRGASPLQDSLKFSGLGLVSAAAGRAALYALSLPVFLAAYYGLQRSVGAF